MSSTTTSRCPFEHIQNPDQEAEQIAETADLTVKLLDKRYPPPEQILRGGHPKSHGCVKAAFTVHPDISPEFQVGLFAEAGRQFDAFIRFSNAAALLLLTDCTYLSDIGRESLNWKSYRSLMTANNKLWSNTLKRSNLTAYL